MKKRIIYICETCGSESEDKERVLICEASHLGLTPSEKDRWDWLNKKVRLCERAACKHNNNNTRDALDSAVAELMSFEASHNLLKDIKSANKMK